MTYQKRSLWIRLLAVCLLVILLVPIQVMAVEPRASYYLTSYNSYLYAAGSGKVQAWFTVTGVNYMDDIGALTIRIYESEDNSTWTWVKTYRHTEYPSMLGHDDYYHSGYVEYQGVKGRYYKAYVTIWAGKDDGGDTRYMWTDVQKAT